jgi:hypothetical protein
LMKKASNARSSVIGGVYAEAPTNDTPRQCARTYAASSSPSATVRMRRSVITTSTSIAFNVEIASAASDASNTRKPSSRSTSASMRRTRSSSSAKRTFTCFGGASVCGVLLITRVSPESAATPFPATLFRPLSEDARNLPFRHRSGEGSARCRAIARSVYRVPFPPFSGGPLSVSRVWLASRNRRCSSRTKSAMR